jgi:N4-gp56 family major capsid protein
VAEALGSAHIVAGEVGNFIPELWSDEIVATYKANLTLRNLVRFLNHKGKKGDTFRIPTPTRGTATAKSAETQVNLQAHGTDAGLTISIDKHYEYSRLIEDFASIQALESLRRFYTDDAGYALGKQVDTDLILAVYGGTIVYTAATNVIESTSTLPTTLEGDGTTWDEAGSTDITDAGIRTFIRTLDNNDVPFADRVMVVPTIVKFDLLGLSRFTEQAFTGEASSANSIRNGLIGNVYGMPVYVSTRLPTVDDSTGNADNKLGLVFQRDAAVLVEQLGMRAQRQYKQEWLADLFTADTIYGVKQLRSTNVVGFVVPST